MNVRPPETLPDEDCPPPNLPPPWELEQDIFLNQIPGNIFWSSAGFGCGADYVLSPGLWTPARPLLGPFYVPGNEGRLPDVFPTPMGFGSLPGAAVRKAAQTKNATEILTQAAVAQCQANLKLGSVDAATALADLAVTGRMAHFDFCFSHPQDAEIQAAVQARIGSQANVTPQLIQAAVTAVLDRAYKVAWFLSGQASRGDLGWIAVSGEDDLPDRPVNVHRTKYPQHDLMFSVRGALGSIAVSSRYAIATSVDPAPPPPATAQRTCPPILQPSLPPGDRIILYIHGSDSRLEEADDLIPHLVRTPDGRPSGFSVISMDLPGSGYVNPIDHTEVGPWGPFDPMVGIGVFGAAQAARQRIAVLPFLEHFIVNFVSALSSRLGQPGLVEGRIAVVMGGSLGGNLALRLAQHQAPWLRNVVAYSPGSVWNALTNVASAEGMQAAKDRPDEPETDASRGAHFMEVFDTVVSAPLPVIPHTQPDMWYRDGWPCKAEYINNARLDRQETYTRQYRRWHWRISLEELAATWRDPGNPPRFAARVLLGAGQSDNYWPPQIFANTQGLAGELIGEGDTFFFETTGHSIHSERPAALARKVLAFVARVRDHKADDYDGDGKTDLAVWRPTDGNWYIIDSSSPTKTPKVRQWGQAGDIPVPGDYDGDGKTDIAYWRPSDGTWYVIESRTDAPRAPQKLGRSIDIPVPGDYDGDGTTEFAVWQPDDFVWQMFNPSTGKLTSSQSFGRAGDIPVPGDYDGDGKTDFAVWRPSDGTWIVLSSAITGTFFGIPIGAVQQWGLAGDIPVPGDYDAADFAVWRPTEGNWYIMDCSTKAQKVHKWGLAGDIPVPGDYDGDGKTDLAVWRPTEGNWYVVQSSTGAQTVQLGQFGDIPLPRWPAPFQMAPTPVINVDGTQSTGGVLVDIGFAPGVPGTESAVIHYTTDGTNPTTNSRVYSGEFVVGQSTIYAIAVIPAGQPSAIATAQVSGQ